MVGSPFSYDSFGQLIRENNKALDKTFISPKEAPRASFFLAKGGFTFSVGCDIIKMFIAVDLFVKDALKHIPIAEAHQIPEI